MLNGTLFLETLAGMDMGSTASVGPFASEAKSIDVKVTAAVVESVGMIRKDGVVPDVVLAALHALWCSLALYSFPSSLVLKPDGLMSLKCQREAPSKIVTLWKLVSVLVQLDLTFRYKSDLPTGNMQCACTNN